MAFLLFAALVLALSSLAAAEGSAPSTEPEDLVVVTATRLPLPVTEIPAAVAVVEGETVRKAGVTDLGGALQLAPAVQVPAKGGPEAATFARLQGASSAQVQVLVDGRPVNNGLSSVDLSLIPVMDVERIEVVQGPASALYGANALGGVVNVITRHPGEASGSQLQLGLGSYGDRSLGFSTSDRLGQAAYLVAGSSRDTSGWRVNSDLSAQSLTGRLTWPAAGGELDLQLRGSASAAGSPGGTGFLATPLARKGDRVGSLDLSYRSAAETGLTARLYSSTETITYDDPDPFFATHSRHEARWSGLEARRTAEVGAHRLVAGGEYRWDAASSTNLTGSPFAGNLGLYVEDLYAAGPAVTVTLGGRLDAHSVYGQVLSPRLGVAWNPSAGRRLWLSAAQAYRAPSFNDLYWTEPWMKGNPNLRPETALAYQAGFTLGPVDLTLYHKDVRDNIDWVDRGAFWQAENLAAARYDGADLVLRRALGSRASAELAYSWLRAVDLDTGLALPYRPANRGTLAVDLTGPSGWQGRAAVKAAGPQFANPANTSECPGFTRLDLTLGREVSARVGWQVKVENALDAQYQEVPGYPMPGRTLSGTVTYRF
jgi:outer membrane receptor for ferrienterochelin and colicins